MCNTSQQPPSAQQHTASEKERTQLDLDYKQAEVALRVAELKAAADYNFSAAGQMQRQFETYQRIAKPLSESKFVPESYRGNIGDCVIAVEIACRLNVFPLTVMQNLCVVKGNPTWKAKFLIACVNSCGRYTTLDYKYTVDGKVGNISYKTWKKIKDKKTEVLVPFERPDLDNVVCVATAIEKATGRELVSPPVSMRMVIGEGWYNKDGSKWPTMPELMLRYRAASYWVSTFAPEISMGFRTAEEQEDIQDIDYEEVNDNDTDAARPTKRPNIASVENVNEKIRIAKEKLRNRTVTTKATETKADTSEQSKVDMP